MYFQCIRECFYQVTRWGIHEVYDGANWSVFFVNFNKSPYYRDARIQIDVLSFIICIYYVFAFVERRSEFILKFYSGVVIYFYYFLVGDEVVYVRILYVVVLDIPVF